MKERLFPQLIKAISTFGIVAEAARLDYPDNPEHGDYSTNIAMISAKKFGISPRALAEKIVAEFEKVKPDFVDTVNIAGAGFINFKLKSEALAREVMEIAKSGVKGPVSALDGKKVMVEYTDPNPFKEFHIGHLMSNAIGESIARLIEYGGAKVIRANWQGDVGPHVAKAIWGAMKTSGSTSGKSARSAEDQENKAIFWGKAYALGASAYETDAGAKNEIDEINKKIYDKSSPEVNRLYEKGRKESLEAFEDIYKCLDTKFDNYFFEGTEGRSGEGIVGKFLKEGVFEKSDGAVIFRGEEYGLHTRVFITSHGLPTYETKELGLNTEKFRLYPDLAESIIITANEQSDYFKVLLKVFSLIDQNIAGKTKHVAHGLMRFASGKMSSRKGNIVSGEALIEEIRELVREKMKESEKSTKKDLSREEAEEVANTVAVGAIKYTILRQTIGSDVIFDSAKSISFEGDSGPYLQYSAVRAKAILAKAEKEGISTAKDDTDGSKERSVTMPDKVGALEKLIVRFPEIVSRARDEFAPQLVASHLISLAGEFNGFYARQTIVDKADPLSPYRVALTKAFLGVIKDGLWLLGIKVPNRM